MWTKKIKKYLRNIIGIIISLIIIYFILEKLSINIDRVQYALKNANWSLICIGVIFIFIGEMFVVSMWQELMKELYQRKLPFYQSFILMFMPNAARYIPGKIWFVFGIAYLAKHWKVDTISALVVTLVTQMMILLTALLSGMIYMGFSGAYNFSIWIFLFIVLILSLILQPRILHFFFELILKLFKKTTKIEHLPKMSLKMLVKTLILGILLWTFIGAGMTISGIGIIEEITWDNFLAITGAFSTSYFIGYASLITPAGLGVREGALVLLLPSILNETEKLIFSFGSRIWMTMAEILIFIIGIILFKFKNKAEVMVNDDQSASHSNRIPTG